MLSLLAGEANAQRASWKPKPPWQRAATTTPAPELPPPSLQSTEKIVKLNFLESNWKTVLEHVAKSTNSSLVAEKVPAKRYSRFDRTMHTPADAIKILNQELEQHGFRLLISGAHLVLIDLDSRRKEYPRPTVTPEWSTDSVDSSAPEATREESAGEESAAEDNSAAARSRKGGEGRDDFQAKSSTSAVAAAKRISTRSRTPGSTGSRSRVRQVAASDEEDEDLDDADPPTAPAAEEIETAVKILHHDVLTIARRVRNAFKTRTELIDEGPRGLPGFRVYREHAAIGNTSLKRGQNPAGVYFSVGLDRDGNRLLVQGHEQELKGVVRLIKALDAVATKPDTTVTTISASKAAVKVASLLQPELDQLAAANQQAENENGPAENGLEREVPGRAGADPRQTQKPERQAATAPEKTAKPGTDALPDLLEGLKGDVSVEAVGDMGVLILRGNQKDVDAVMSIIREIERLSLGTAPEVKLLMLEYVSSEAMGPLLTSVYDRLGTVRGRTVQPSRKVGVIPILRPNAILIIASSEDLDAVIKLAQDLDQPVDPRTEFKVFPLKYAVPATVVQMVEELYPPQGRTQTGDNAQTTSPGLAPRVKVTADIRTNSVVVVARRRDLREVELLIRKLDSNQSGSVNQLRIYPLKYALADELVSTLQEAILSSGSSSTGSDSARGRTGGNGGGENAGNAGGSGGKSSADGKSSILKFLAIEGKNKRFLRSGILEDIRLSSDSRTNSIIVTAPEESLSLIAELIGQFDRPAPSVAEIKVFSLGNGDATTMSQLLEKLFSPRGGSGSGGEDQLGVQVAGAEDASSGLIPIRFSVDIRTNSIIAIGGAEALRVAEAVLLRLDESEIRQRQSTVYRLKNSPAVAVAQSVNQFLTSRRQVESTDSGLVSPFEQIEREVVVVPEPVSNTLIISSTPRYFNEIRDLVIKLDAAPAQVIIQALLVEVTLENTDEFGIEIGLQDSLLFKRSVTQPPTTISTTNTSPNGVATTTQTIISQTGIPGYLFNSTDPLGNNTNPAFSPQNVGSQGLSNLGVGRTDSSLGYGGLVLSAGSESVNLLLRALAARRRVDILSRPQIRTLDNQPGLMQVGQQYPRVNGFTQNATTGISTPLIQQTNIGIILTVTPRISPDQAVVMEVSAEKSGISPTNGVPLISNPNGSVVTSPILDIALARTTVSVRSGQTVVMGGMITKNDEKIEHKVPILGDLPLIGLGFRYDKRSTRRTELLIFLTPRVIHGDGESELIKQIETERIHFLEKDAEQVHGPILAVPAGSGLPLPEEVFGEPDPNGYLNDPNVPTSIMPSQTGVNQMPVPVEQNSGNIPVLPLPPAKAGGLGQ